MHVLLTGHTGFKGAWMTLLLRAKGHRVSGVALDPEEGSLFSAAAMADLYERDLRLDVRDADGVRTAIGEVAPDVVVHLAAQPLVLESYRDPRTTFESNVMGTLNVLEAVAATPSVRAHLVITTDKVYRNVGRREGYREDEALGAADPYSTSKAMADLLAQSWIRSFDGPPAAIARAGNVVGGGDHSRDRLLPDLMRAFAQGRQAEIRRPESVRPWQHVLDCVTGYWAIVDALLEGRGTGEWNIGPGVESFVTVAEVADLAAANWGDGALWRVGDVPPQSEAGLLALDNARAERELGWRNVLTYPECVTWTVDWHRAVEGGEQPRLAAQRQVERFLERQG
ncbi:CDP-glucose 4,6-dehydratase [Microbacterium sp. HJ5]